ncbi:hypothetical protein EDB89DRAFT_1921491 [Lactarius sanguifluus]|nr:hypothetical protein EDB89DRAFT_1921491 [Lactarius sanguifluus]
MLSAGTRTHCILFISLGYCTVGGLNRHFQSTEEQIHALNTARSVSPGSGRESTPSEYREGTNHWPNLIRVS